VDGRWVALRWLRQVSWSRVMPMARSIRPRLPRHVFFAEHYLTQAEGLKISIVSGSIGTLALTADQF
jgi:hypothetical protein